MTTKQAATALCLVLAALTTLITATTSVARAGGADPRIPVGNTSGEIPADVCGFPIHISAIADREYVVQRRENLDGSITTRVTGSLTNRLTNLDTGASIDYDNGGPGTFTVYPDNHASLDFQGKSIAWVRAAHKTRLGAPALRLVSGGHTRGRLDASGDIVELSMTGHVVDGCDLLF